MIALGAMFSALEVVPLVLIGFEAWENIRLARATQAISWVSAYKWPIYFFVAVAFWNFVGAGLFGFLINPPIALLLHARTEHDAGARTHRAVRSIRNAGTRVDVVLPARAATGYGVEGQAAVRSRSGLSTSGSALMVLVQHAADRLHAGLGFG